MKGKLLLAAAIAVTCGTLSARAAVYTLGTANPDISGYTGPYGTVTVNLTDSTHATVTFVGNTVGGNQFLFGGAQMADLNVNASSFSVGSFSGANSGTGFNSLHTGYPHITGGNVSTFGKFNLTLDNFDGFTSSFNTLSFVLTATSGTWGNDSDVLTPNGDGYMAAAHIFVTTYPANARNDALATGFAADGPVPVPDGGSTLALLGLAFLGLGSLRGVLARS